MTTRPNILPNWGQRPWVSLYHIKKIFKKSLAQVLKRLLETGVHVLFSRGQDSILDPLITSRNADYWPQRCDLLTY